MPLANPSGLSYVPATGGSITNNPGGGNGSIQFNDNGAFGGFVASGDATIDTATGIVTVNRISGPGLVNYVGVTATYAILADDYIVDATANTFTATLPTAVGREGKVYVIKNSGTGTLTIATTSAQTIDGEPNYLLAVQYESISIVSDGSNWKVF